MLGWSVGWFTVYDPTVCWIQRSVDLRSNGLLDGLRFVSLMFGWFTGWIIEDLGFRV